jgi:hypothetical protein
MLRAVTTLATLVAMSLVWATNGAVGGLPPTKLFVQPQKLLVEPPTFQSLEVLEGTKGVRYLRPSPRPGKAAALALAASTRLAAPAAAAPIPGATYAGTIERFSIPPVPGGPISFTVSADGSGITSATHPGPFVGSLPAGGSCVLTFPAPLVFAPRLPVGVGVAPRAPPTLESFTGTSLFTHSSGGVTYDYWVTFWGYFMNPQTAHGYLEFEASGSPYQCDFHNWQWTATTTGAAPVSTALPELTGTQEVAPGLPLALLGNTISVSDGVWSGAPTLIGYRWMRCETPYDETQFNNCVAISGATGSSYTLAAADLGHSIQAVVTATNGAGSTSTAAKMAGWSADVRGLAGSVGAPNPLSDDADITGAAQVGETLTAVDGTWGGETPITFGHQWSRCDAVAFATCVPIPGAAGSAYHLTPADEGHYIEVSIVGSNAYGANGFSLNEFTTEPIGPAARPPVPPRPPTSGTTNEARPPAPPPPPPPAVPRPPPPRQTPPSPVAG